METEKRLIDVDEALYKIYELPDLQHFAEWYVCYDGVCDVLKNAPTVDAVEVVHAHWIPDDYYDICSHCNHPVVLHDRRKPDRYCRNCGAKMDGVSDG